MTSVSDSRESASRPANRAVRRLVGAFVVLFVIVFAAPIVWLAISGRSTWIAPNYSNTLVKVGRAELMRHYSVAPDSSITPMQAGEAFHSLRARSNRPLNALLRPISTPPIEFPAADKSLFTSSGVSPWSGPAAMHLIELAHKGFSRAEMDYLATIAANPVWEPYGVLARARRVDFAGGALKIPIPQTVSPFEIPIPAFAGTKEVAYANVARAAWMVANNKPADAEQALRQTIAVGLHLIDDGNSLIDNLIGAVTVGIGRTAIEELFSVTGNPELAAIQAATAEYDRAHASTDKAPAADRAATLAVTTDPKQPRGVRFEMALALSSSVCASAKEVLFGPPAEISGALDRAGAQLGRSPAEKELFDVDRQVVERATTALLDNMDGLGPRAMLWMARVPSFLLQNPRIANCIALQIVSVKLG